MLAVIAAIAVLAGLLLPAASRTRGASLRILCLGNLRQMAMAAQIYVDGSGGFYPPAYYHGRIGERAAAFAWDFTTIEARTPSVVPGLLWEGQGDGRIHRCPTFTGGANWLSDPYTGYNYNTSYLGHGEHESIKQPAKAVEVRNPSKTVAFGDGQYAAGADKFMRAPWANPGDASFRDRWSGTQGFRHMKKTNIASCDGHAESLDKRFTQNADGSGRIAPGTGFLSPDNSLYDLE